MPRKGHFFLLKLDILKQYFPALDAHNAQAVIYLLLRDAYCSFVSKREPSVFGLIRVLSLKTPY